MTNTATGESPSSFIIDGELKCAHCGFNYVHFSKPIVHYVGDEYDDYNPMMTRGNWIEIPYKCENCPNKTSILNISFHKGQTLYRTYKKRESTKRDFEDITRKDPPTEWPQQRREIISNDN